jgi:hypothetical protein
MKKRKSLGLTCIFHAIWYQKYKKNFAIMSFWPLGVTLDTNFLTLTGMLSNVRITLIIIPYFVYSFQYFRNRKSFKQNL